MTKVLKVKNLDCFVAPLLAMTPLVIASPEGAWQSEKWDFLYYQVRKNIIDNPEFAKELERRTN